MEVVVRTLAEQAGETDPNTPPPPPSYLVSFELTSQGLNDQRIPRTRLGSLPVVCCWNVIWWAKYYRICRYIVHCRRTYYPPLALALALARKTDNVECSASLLRLLTSARAIHRYVSHFHGPRIQHCSARGKSNWCTFGINRRWSNQ